MVLSKPGADFIFAINEGIEKTSNRREGENPGLSFTSSLKNWLIERLEANDAVKNSRFIGKVVIKTLFKLQNADFLFAM